MNNWQSIDFRESMNALLSQKLLEHDNGYQLPTVIWHDNSGEQTWTTLDTFGGGQEAVLPLGTGNQTISNQYAQEDFDRYANPTLPSTKTSMQARATKSALTCL